MKRIILFTTSFIFFLIKLDAQTNSSKVGQQVVDLALNNALEITFASNNSTIGTIISLPFTTVSDYANGVISNNQVLNIKSNKNFKIFVKTATSKFTITNGGTNTTSSMPSSILALQIVTNSTGGTLGSGFSLSSYKTLNSSSNTTLINNALHGGSRYLTIKYKAAPGFTYPAGTYNINVVYTATQL